MEGGDGVVTVVFSVLYPYDLVHPPEDRVSDSQEEVMSFDEPLRKRSEFSVPSQTFHLLYSWCLFQSRV